MFAAGVQVDRAAVEHRQAPGNVEAAHGDRNPSGCEWPCNVERAGILVGLNADKRDKPEIVVLPEAGEQRGHVDPGVRLINHFDVDGDVRPKHLPLGAIVRNCINGSERIRWDHRPPPANHVAIIAVMRRFYQHERENTGSRIHANAYSAATDATVGWTKMRVSQLVSAAS